ncbi:bifunctional 3-(3-hydroxy-phenyl)propionate/3-hydroxycinnamic acid hydroxylase [Granulosicoccus sp.]|nr:bifunctional 3-(3-hydroxy-phenyl)propionate/3-hydroxycinnamic acid hydroxylase [Granulosicoccus sp.]MDB4222956.1 bifunctional 3-(3-hydroxy-phenyl)propionate/3-hydroxycinnamic acid hydroxylase [Granulosicoccus sp.]
MQSLPDTDVAVIGAGPVGTLLAILLGKHGKRVTLVERWPTLYDRPRAVTMDHEVARILATFGIDCNNDPAIQYHEELYYWKNANLEDLQIVDWKSVSSSGWRVTYWFNQPELEARLLAIAATIPSIKLIRSWEAVSIEQDENGVSVELQETKEIHGPDGQRQSLRASYLVGCDGANSFVREHLGIGFIDKGYFFDWLILDMVPADDYKMSPAQWQLCDPKRPTTLVPGGPGRRRWEFMVLPEESSEEIAKPASAWKLLEPWGINPDNATLERSAVYRFQARWAEQWRVKRCMIAGDAAHLMPPFAGEGMCAGFRDAVALSWRLNAIIEGKLDDAVLDSYESERIHHAKHYIDFSQQLGKIICITDEEEAAERDRSMKADLAARNHEPITGDLVHLGTGAWCEDTAAAGELSTQGYVEVGGKRDRFDQIVGQGWMVVGFNVEPADALSTEQLDALKFLDGKTVKIGSPGSDCDAIDLDGTYAKWLASIESKYFILRPDFYVAATADSAADLNQRFQLVLEKLHVCKMN